MNNLSIIRRMFDYNDVHVRVIVDSGSPWWVAQDVCQALGIDTCQVRRLDHDEKGLRLVDTAGGMQKMVCVNEPGLYNLILGSRKPAALAFKRWITHEVLPSIRKTGSYSIQQQKPMTYLEALKAHLQVVQGTTETQKRLGS